ncbi:MAG: hypothetical protein K9N10_07345 [Deltaproteobacteria bacterium]|nr:hypothetical protein [Deltaproteobacteria bacterium]
MRYKISIAVLLATVVFLISGCRDSSAPTESSVEKPKQKQQSPSPKYSDAEICKGVIAAVMGRDPSIITASSGSDNVVALSYKRESDGTNWSYRCKVDGGAALWASDTGRWRNDPADSKITLSLSDNEDLVVTETYGDGSNSKSEFSKSQLSSN